MRSSLRLLLVSFILSATVGAGEIGYIEDFALAPDRSEAIKLLIPGSEDFYYYSSLHLQQLQQFDKVNELLKQWISRYGHTQRVTEIQLRQALLAYERNPKGSLEFLRRHLNLEFNHQREAAGEKPNLPSEFDDRVIQRDNLFESSLSRFSNLDGFEDSALDWLVGRTLDPGRRRALLQRLQRPDYPNLVKLIADDLNHENSPGFGAFPIHQQLLLDQLDQLLTLQPNLLNQQNLVNTYLTKLQPHADSDWQRDPKEKEAYLERLWAFASRLAPVHNSLKVHVLYHWLSHDRTQGEYNKERFMAYISLPRNTSYIARSLLERAENRSYAADLNADFQSFTLLPPIGNDEPVVRDYLQHFFLEENTTKPYEPFINDVFLRIAFAETKILHGLGDPEQWYALLPPDQYQQLKERIDLDFAPTNRAHFAADEQVTLDVDVKNVRTLLVKVFEVNTRNFYRQYQREVNTDISLDGLIANDERTVEYRDPPLRRIRRHFEFPSLARPGVFVIDFIGNGMSSRVVVRKGQLRHTVRTSTAGHIFTIFDDKNQHVVDATLWLNGREYHPGKDGRIVVPYTDKPGAQPLVISRGEFSSLDSFNHQSENHTLTAGIHVDRETLLAGRTAQVVIRPALHLNGMPVTLSVLEDVKLTIATVDLDGVKSTKEVSDFELLEDRESTYDFQTPPRLASLTFTLSAKVKNLSQNKKIDVSTSQSFSLNSIDKTDKVEDLHLARIEQAYVLELLGKSGESKPDRVVQLAFKHRDFRELVSATLKTDPRGRISLGLLTDIESITATGPEGTSRAWRLVEDQHAYHQSRHGAAGQPIEIPLMHGQPDPDKEPDANANKPIENKDDGDRPSRAQVSLLELRGETYVADRFDHLRIKDGMLVANGLAAGDYDLWLKRPNQKIRIRLAKGEKREGYVLGSVRLLELRGESPLQIAEATHDNQSLRIRLHNSTKFARVHVFATRYLPANDPYANLARIADPEPTRIILAKPDARYVSGRNIGDEYRYIIDRKFAQKYPGVMLERPSLLLNPWAVRTTQTEQQVAREGTEFAATPPAPSNQTPSADAPIVPAVAIQEPLTANLDFLSQTSVVLANLIPDEMGQITIPLERLGAHQHIHIVAVDPTTTVRRSISLPEKPMDFRDLRLANGLEPDLHFTQQKRISVIGKGGAFELKDVVTSKFETYDSLERVFALYATLSGNPHLAEFRFIVQWPDLKPEEKQDKYSKYACHELNFFLFKKDPEFFQSVVKPYLANKKDRTFLDNWLLEESLDVYLQPWHYSQLNVIERILLAERIAEDREHGKRHVLDSFDLLPTDVDRFNLLFRTAVQGRALEVDDELGVIAGVRLNVELADRAERERLSAAGALGIMGRAAGGGAAAPEAPAQHEALERDALEEMDGAKKLSEARADSKELRQRVSRAKRGGMEAGKPADAYYFADTDERKLARQFFQQLDKTQEWAENNYYKLTIEQQNAGLVTVNTFWRDYAQQQQAGSPFLSVNFADASRNFTEMMFAMALLDLPFKADKHDAKFDQATMRITAASPMIVFHEEIRPASTQAQQTPVLVSQNFFGAHDRYRHENNERVDKFVTEEFLTHTVYGCQVVVTNPTSSPQKLDVLTQIPVGSVPVSGGEATRGTFIQLQPFSTHTIEYYFYFPAAGKYAHYPVHVAKNEQLLASAEPVILLAVDKLSRVDRESWEYVSQYGSDQEVLDFLQKANLQRLNLDKIAFRMQSPEYFQKVVELLARRHAYSHTLWSYAIKHNASKPLGEFIRHAQEIVGQIGEYLESPLVTIDPIDHKTYQHLEYLPLVNPRAHRLGRRRQVLNDRLAEQYHRLLKVLGYKRELSDEDRLSVTYYMLLQDRFEEAREFFEQVNAENLTARMQYDYFSSFFELQNEDLETAQEIAQRYDSHPVDRWRETFAAVKTHIAEAKGGTSEVLDPENRTQVQTQLAATEPAFEFQVEDNHATVNYQNLKQVTVNYYLMDIELLFSQNPFVQSHGGQFSHIRPNHSQRVDLPADQQTFRFELPKEMSGRNVLIEITGQGQTKSQPHFANTLAVSLTENYGQLRVATKNPGKPLSKVYVKVYARMKDGSVRFYKDGYTDLRGRFDYASLNTNELENVDRFSLLILSEDRGAVVRETRPPQQ